jgi:hypothetical protein
MTWNGPFRPSVGPVLTTSISSHHQNSSFLREACEFLECDTEYSHNRRSEHLSGDEKSLLVPTIYELGPFDDQDNEFTNEAFLRRSSDPISQKDLDTLDKWEDETSSAFLTNDRDRRLRLIKAFQTNPRQVQSAL